MVGSDSARPRTRIGLVDPEPLRYPADALAERVRGALRDFGSVVVAAPPGTGKTTRLPLLILDSAGTDRLIVTEPRRVATRAAASRMAATLGERVGDTVGYRMRDETKVSARTRIEVVTEGVFLRMLQHDPGLDGVSTVLFDEVHERSLDIDLSLTLAVNARAILRPDLRLVAMSATLDSDRFATLLNSPVVATEDRIFPIDVSERPTLIADIAVGVVGELHDLIGPTVVTKPASGSDNLGDILVFLPGSGEIRAVERLLGRRPLGPDVVVHTLTGATPTADVSDVLESDRHGRRKVILATSVAQTSITIRGVRTVIDSGLTRRSSFDPRTGLSRLVTERSTKATARQRAGRAGREAPGTVVRLWSATEFERSPDDDVAEIVDADLADVVLQLAVWGVTDSAELAWIDPPPPDHWSAAVQLLQLLGALDPVGKPTERGMELARLPLPARVGTLLLAAADTGDEATMERAVNLASELVGGSSTPGRLRRLVGHRAPSASLRAAKRSAGQLAALTFPERIAGRVGEDAGRYQLASGAIAVMSDGDPLRGTPVIVVLEIDGDRRSGRIFRSIAVTADEVLELGMTTSKRRVSRRLPSGRIETIESVCLGKAVLATKPTTPTADDIVDAVLAGLDVEALLRAGSTAAIRARVEFLRGIDPTPSSDGSAVEQWPDWSIPSLVAAAPDWLGPALRGQDAKDPMRGIDVASLLLAQLGPVRRRQLDVGAPSSVPIPTGRSVAVDYLDPGGPTIEAKLQEFFGVGAGPRIASGRVAVRLVLLSPAGRPAAVTSDLAAFWASGYAAVRADLRGRYPRHPWPDDPAAAVPTIRAKPRT